MSSTSDKICRDSASTKSNNDDFVMNNMLQQMSMADNDVVVCANCGKEGSSNNMNTCNKCKMVKYCNAICKKVHKKKHKKDCEEYQRLAAERRNDELRRAAELHDKELFKQPPPKEDCPICFVRLPSLETSWRYQSCCGKIICSGCLHAPVYDCQGNVVAEEKCAFCRVPVPKSNEKIIQRMMDRMEAGDPIAIYNNGVYHRHGKYGVPQDCTKSLELWHRAAELGHSEGYLGIGNAYYYGRGVGVDKKKAKHYYELAAMGGCEGARFNLGLDEWRASNKERALKHHMIAVRDGYADSLNEIKELYSYGRVTKDEYTEALKSYQTYLGEIKSVQRDKAASANDQFRYY